MPKHIVKILDTAFVTHNVKRFQVEKPRNYSFTPGQATELALRKTGWKDEARSFNFTSLPESKTLEFIIKIYDEHQGVTHQLGLAHVEPARLIDCFPDLMPGTAQCPNDCDHLDPEGGELDAWVTAGHSSAERLDSLRRLLVSRDA